MTAVVDTGTCQKLMALNFVDVVLSMRGLTFVLLCETNHHFRIGNNRSWFHRSKVKQTTSKFEHSNPMKIRV
jgi:hypothetical protein